MQYKPYALERHECLGPVREIKNAGLQAELVCKRHYLSSATASEDRLQTPSRGLSGNQLPCITIRPVEHPRRVHASGSIEACYLPSSASRSSGRSKYSM